MATYNSFGQNNSNSNFNTNSAVENKGLFSRILRGLSSYGMNYDDMIVRNQVGVGINEDPYSARGNSMYDFFSQRAVSSVLNRKSIPYLDKAYADKRRILREYSIKDELRDFISSLADECIVYSDDNDFCSPKALSKYLNVKGSGTRVFANLRRPSLICTVAFERLLLAAYCVIFSDNVLRLSRNTFVCSFTIFN